MTPKQVLDDALRQAQAHLHERVIEDGAIAGRVEYVCRCASNRAGVRLLMSCLLAKIHQPHVDPRETYTEIGGSDCFSGRTYDEQYITDFSNENDLPCNPTTAFLTPALRNIDRPLTTEVVLVGRPRLLYVHTLQLLDDVFRGRVSAHDLLVETIRLLILERDANQSRMATLLEGMRGDGVGLPLSSESIVALIQQHMACKNSSRLGVLIVAAAYLAASARLGEQVRTLHAHNAADLQTGALGDVEVCLVGDDNVVTAYEMKMRRVTVADINAAVDIERIPAPMGIA